MAKAKKAKSAAKPKKKGRQPDKAVASDSPRSQLAKVESKSLVTAQDKSVDATQPQEDAECKIERVRSIWEALDEQEQADLLNVPIRDLIDLAAANEAADGGRMSTASISQVLMPALERQQEMSTWRVWIWPQGNEVFPCAQSLSMFLHDSVLSSAFQQLLPSECLGDVESEEQEAVRVRMRRLFEDVQTEMKEHVDKMSDGAVKMPSVRKLQRRNRLTMDQIIENTKNKQIDMIIKMAGEISEEDEFLYQLVAFPINQFLNTTLPDSMRQSRYHMPARPATAAEVHFDELNSLSPEHVRVVFFWVLEKVECFATAFKRPASDQDRCGAWWSPDAAEIFVLSEDREHLCVSPRWQEFLKCQPCQPDAGDDSPEKSPHDLLLQWIYGTVASHREKARDGARRSLYHGHTPDGQSVFSLLRAALNRQEKLQSAYDSGMELLRCILKHRARIEELVKAYPAMLERAYNKTNTVGERGRASFQEDEFPTKAVIAQLEREQSLTLAKLHILKHGHDKGVATAQKLRQEQRRGEPLFERMRKQFEEAKQAQKGVESCRTAPDMDRHRQAAADAAMEGQMQAQCNVRAQGSYLQGLSNRITECEQENSKQAAEMKQLSRWKGTISRSLEALKDYQEMLERGLGTSARHEQVIMTLPGSNQPVSGPRTGQERQHFFESLRRQLYNDTDDHQFYSAVQSSLKELKLKMRDGRAAICHLHQHLLAATCDDPSPAIGMLLVLPYIQKRLDSMLQAHAATQAQQAEAELLMATDTLSEIAMPAKGAKKKKKSKPKSAPARAVEVDESVKAAAEAARSKAEQQQRLRLEALERQRQIEDELLEKRKQELMQEEHGFWRQRMEQDKREKELMNATQTSECGPPNADDSRECSPRIGTSNERSATVQCKLMADETRQQHAADVQTGRNGRAVQTSSQMCKSGVSVPQQGSPSSRPNIRPQGLADVPGSARRPLPPPGRHMSMRHGQHTTTAQLGTIPARRCDDARPAGSNASHLSQTGSAAQTMSGSTGEAHSVSRGTHAQDHGRKASDGRSSIDKPAGYISSCADAASARQLQSTGKRQEYIATGQVVGVPVHMRADHSVATSSRTSSVDLHAVPRVEHVTHVRIGMRSEGQSLSNTAVEDYSSVPMSNLNTPRHGPCPPAPHGVAAPARSSDTAQRAPHAADTARQSDTLESGIQAGQSSCTPQMTHPSQHQVPAAHVHHAHALPHLRPPPVPPVGPPKVHATAVGNAAVSVTDASGDKAARAGPPHAGPLQGTQVRPVAGPATYMPLPCTHPGPAPGYPPDHSMQTAVYYAPVSMGIPNAAQQPFYVQHVDGMYVQTHPYGMVYQPAHYQAVMHPVPHFPPGAMQHPQFPGMSWAPAKQLNAQAPAFVPGHAHGDAVPSHHHAHMRPPPPGMYHVHPTSIHQQQHVPGRVPSGSSDGCAQPGCTTGSQQSPAATAATGPEIILSTAPEDRSDAPQDADSAATDSNSSSSTITAEPCCEASHDCCVSKGDCESGGAPADAPAAPVHSRTQLASIRTETAANKLRESHTLASKSPRSPSSSKKRASKKARKITAVETSKSLAVLENQHEARYKLVGGRVGLRNRFGQNHCFLNVIVQALWHLQSFSKELMLLDVRHLPGKISSHSEWRLLSALASLFSEFEATSVADDSSPTLSPDGLRSALPSAFANEGDMHDAHEVLHEMFSALHFAQAGGGPGSSDPTLPLLSFVPEAHASRPPVVAASVAETTWARRVGADDQGGPSSLVINTFGMRVQVPNPQESPLPGRIAVDRFVRYFHHVNTEPLINAFREASTNGAPFDWSQAVQRSGFDAGADVPLLSQPRVVTLTIVWHTARPTRRHIQDVCDTMQTAETLDICKLFTGTKRPTHHHLRCVITYQHLHYVAFVRDPSQGWLMLNDSRITKFGDWGKASRFMVEDELLPIVLFYES